MYTVFNVIEKSFRFIRIILILTYYKMKYGKRLQLGRGIHFRKGFTVNISKEGKVKIGNGCFFNNYCSINCHKEITIGDKNIFGENVKIYDHNHVFNREDVDMRYSFNSRAIAIGDNNWIGSDSVILSHARIGSNNVIGAGIVIDQEITSDNLVRRTNDKEITKIERTRQS
ncbi:MAG: acyltransferase [Clostridia bacterium]|nr:acyltransferase [Clostridia bacterium]